MASSPGSALEGLLPGYKHVEEFGSDHEYEEEVEESYITLDLGNLDPALVPSSSTYRLIGLDTPTPFLQLSGTIMQGEYKTLLGTELFFKGSTEEETQQQGAKYLFSTNRRIQFNEVELRPKGAPSASSKDGKPTHAPSQADTGAEEAGSKGTEPTSRAEVSPVDTKVTRRSMPQGTDIASSAAASPSSSGKDQAIDIDE